jgi:hypothetical protein
MILNALPPKEVESAFEIYIASENRPQYSESAFGGDDDRRDSVIIRKTFNETRHSNGN